MLEECAEPTTGLGCEKTQIKPKSTHQQSDYLKKKDRITGYGSRTIYNSHDWLVNGHSWFVTGSNYYGID
jgi:hypothetical protein